MASKATVIAVVNQKGGTAKTTTCENLGVGLAMEGKKVLCIDMDPQASLTIALGWQRPDDLNTTAQKCIPDEEYQNLKARLDKRDDLDLEHVF